MIFKAIKSWLLFEKELMSVNKEMKKAKVFHHCMKKEKEQ